MTKNKLIVSLFLGSCTVFAQKQKTEDLDLSYSDDKMIVEYIQSKRNSYISFDPSNIKQFWVDNSVVSKKNTFAIILNPHESVPLLIQLANVNETLDCNIDVIAETKDIEFTVLNEGMKRISSSKKEDAFIGYSVLSSSFHLEDTPNYRFNLKFASKSAEIISIKKIILSFCKNNNSLFLSSPGAINYSDNNLKTTSSKITNTNANAFSVVGKRSALFSTKRILVTDNPISCTVSVKNIGNVGTDLYIGFAAYTRNGIQLNGRNYPYNNNSKVLNVISSLKGSEKILVDAYSDWTRNCYLALNAKEDMSDIPNTSLAVGRIINIQKLENGQAEITLDKPFNTELEKGTKVRIHGLTGAYLYISWKRLEPGEEQIFTSTIQKDDAFLQYSPQAFSRGVYFIVPLLLSYSTDPNADNMILINNYSITY